MLCVRRAAARILLKPSPPTNFLAHKPRSITTLRPLPLPTTRLLLNSSFQKRFASDEPQERHPALGESEPIAPQAQSAEPFDISEIQPTDAREVPQPDQPSVTEHLDAAVEQSALAAADPAAPAGEAAAAPASENEAALAGASAAGLAEARAAGLAQGTPAAGQEQASDDRSRQLYVGNLFFDVTEEDLRREFAKHGAVTDVRLIYDSRGLSKGFAYIDFLNRDAAETAMNALDRQIFEGRRLSVQWASPRSRTAPRFGGVKNPPTKTLFIGNMSFELSDQDLNDLFRDIKNVLDVRVAIDRRTGQPRGFAHADFTDVQSAELAMQKLEGKELYGRHLRVDFSMPSARVRPVH